VRTSVGGQLDAERITQQRGRHLRTVPEKLDQRLMRDRRHADNKPIVQGQWLVAS
jgi:hypothetical protein